MNQSCIFFSFISLQQIGATSLTLTQAEGLTPSSLFLVWEKIEQWQRKVSKQQWIISEPGAINYTMALLLCEALLFKTQKAWKQPHSGARQVGSQLFCSSSTTVCAHMQALLTAGMRSASLGQQGTSRPQRTAWSIIVSLEVKVNKNMDKGMQPDC